MKFQEDDTVAPFGLKGGGMIYVIHESVIVETGDGTIKISLESIRSCSSRGRRLDMVWHENGPVHITLHLSQLPAAAAETAIFERIYAYDAP